MLRETFISLLTKYSDDKNLVNELWAEIEKSHTNKKRHYHTLQHLDNLLAQLVQIKEDVVNWDAILFSIYYHDIIYNPSKSNNEKKSAELAKKRMELITIPVKTIEHCEKQILATKSHVISADTDTNYFTDADLTILGMTWEAYSQYYKGVRKEYSIYPDFIYKPGRKKVLDHFLSMDSIFKTDFFYNKYEVQAKINLQREKELLYPSPIKDML